MKFKSQKLGTREAIPVLFGRKIICEEFQKVNKKLKKALDKIFKIKCKI
jgi:hypothetical protein